MWQEFTGFYLGTILYSGRIELGIVGFYGSVMKGGLLILLSSILRQDYSFFQSEFSSQCGLVLALSVSRLLLICVLCCNFRASDKPQACTAYLISNIF